MIQSSFYEFFKTHLRDFQEKYQNGLICLTNDKNDAQKLADVASFLGIQSFVLEDLRAVFGEDLRSYQEELREILNTLKNFYTTNSPKILFSPLQTLLNPMPKLEALEGFSIGFGESLELREFQETLLHFGYEFVELVEMSGEVSIRGDIIDLFLPNYENPIRLSLFCNEIESIRFFDVQTQLCFQEEIEKLEIVHAFFNLSAKSYEKLLSKIQEANIENSLHYQGNLIAAYGLWFLEEKQNLLEIYPYLKAPNIQDLLDELLSFQEQNKELLKQILEHKRIEVSQNYEDFECAFRNIPTFLEFQKNKKITIIANTERLIRHAGISLGEHKEQQLVLGKDYVI